MQYDEFITSVRERGIPSQEGRDAVEPGEFDDVLARSGRESAELIGSVRSAERAGRRM